MRKIIMAALIAVLAAVFIGATVSAPVPAEAAEGDCTIIVHRAIYGDTENQPDGVRYAARWGWTEPDAQITRDGYVVAAHDANLSRLTGGDSTAAVRNVTWQQLQSFDHPYGQFRQTKNLIRAAAEVNTPIMVNLHRSATWTPAALDELYTAAQDHPRPQVVYFGGKGSVELMVDRHSDVATFHRFATDATREQMVTAINNKGYDLVALRKPSWTTANVDAVRAAGGGTRVATAQITPSEVDEAEDAGIEILQGNRPAQMVKECT